MAFSMELASLIANQLSRFVTLNRHQLAGQVANVDFWIAQVRHALDVIDNYGARYVRMEGAQEFYVTRHNITELDRGAPAGPVERRPAPPRRIPDRELQKARRALLESVRRFLARCRNEGLISEAQMSDACKVLGVEENSSRNHGL